MGFASLYPSYGPLAVARRDSLALTWAELNERGLTMPRKILPRIATVAADAAPMTLQVRWDKGDESRVDVSGMIESFRVYAPRALELG